MPTRVPRAHRELHGQLAGGLAAFVLGLPIVISSVVDLASVSGHAWREGGWPSSADATAVSPMTVVTVDDTAATVAHRPYDPGGDRDANGLFAPTPTPASRTSAGDQLIPGPTEVVEQRDLRADLLSMSAAQHTGRWTYSSIPMCLIADACVGFESDGLR